MTARFDFDPLAPQREAAFFYGLFLRGHRVEDLRQDIDVPRNMLDKWLQALLMSCATVTARPEMDSFFGQ